MCTTQVWTYRECECHYHYVVPCHPCFTAASSTPRRRRTNVYLPSVSSSSDHSTTSTNSSTSVNGDPLARFCRQCSIRHVVHKNFLEPICDDCLLEELGLQPELGPIWGGKDLQEGLHGEEWILESNVEIKIEDSDDEGGFSTGREDEDEDDAAADADDEEESQAKSGRRRRMDMSRDALRISSDLFVDVQEGAAILREQPRGAEPEGNRMARSVFKAPKNGRLSKPSWSQPGKRLSRKSKHEIRSASISPTDEGSADSSRYNSLTRALDGRILGAATSSPKPSSATPREDAGYNSLETLEDVLSCYHTDAWEDGIREAQCENWLLHLQADLREKDATRNHLAEPVVIPSTLEQGQQSESSIPSSSQKATPFNSASSPLLNPPSAPHQHALRSSTPAPTASVPDQRLYVHT